MQRIGTDSLFAHMKRIFLVILVWIVALAVCPFSAKAYTEEEKKAAKSWLSAHGYPPTEDGAWEAYSDWLDGMWWDEFGSPDEYFGVGEGDDEDEDDEEKPTAATQRSQGEGADADAGAGMLIGALAETDTAESEGLAADESTESYTEESTEETAREQEAAAVIETTVEESPTAATQGALDIIYEQIDENNAEKEQKAVPFALAGIGAVGVLLAGALILEKRKKK